MLRQRELVRTQKEEIEMISKQLCVDPSKVTTQQLLSVLGPNVSSRLPTQERNRLKDVTLAISFIANPLALHCLQEVWVNAAKTGQVSNDSAATILCAILQHPSVSDETIIDLAATPIDKVREGIRNNTNLPNRIRLIATV